MKAGDFSGNKLRDEQYLPHTLANSLFSKYQLLSNVILSLAFQII